MKYNINMVNDSYLQSGFSLIEIIVSLALFSVVDRFCRGVTGVSVIK